MCTLRLFSLLLSDAKSQANECSLHVLKTDPSTTLSHTHTHLPLPSPRPPTPPPLQVSEQMDSLRVLNTDPVDYLVTPRVLASMIAGPILNVLCFCMGVWVEGGGGGQMERAGISKEKEKQSVGGSLLLCLLQVGGWLGRGEQQSSRRDPPCHPPPAPLSGIGASCLPLRYRRLRLPRRSRLQRAGQHHRGLGAAGTDGVRRVHQHGQVLGVWDHRVNGEGSGEEEGLG